MECENARNISQRGLRAITTRYNPAGIYFFKVNNRNTSCKICSKLAIKAPVSLLLTLN